MTTAYAVFASFKSPREFIKKYVNSRPRSVEMSTKNSGRVHFDRVKVLIFLLILLNNEILMFKRTVLIVYVSRSKAFIVLEYKKKM